MPMSMLCKNRVVISLRDERQLYIPPDDDWISRSDVSGLPLNDD
jgi:hypothetical protein